MKGSVRAKAPPRCGAAMSCNWPELTKLFPVARLAARVDELAEVVDAEELRPREAEALRQALHFSRGEGDKGDPPKTGS